MVRKTDIGWLTEFCAGLGLRLVTRFPTQFTELYVHIPARPLKRLVYRFNQAWFDRGGSARGAMGNMLVFEKRA